MNGLNSFDRNRGFAMRCTQISNQLRLLYSLFSIMLDPAVNIYIKLLVLICRDLMP